MSGSCLLSQSEWLEIPDFESGGDDAFESNESEKSLKAARASFEKRFIIQVLSENGGNISKTAQCLGLERSHLHKKIKNYGIDVSTLGQSLGGI